MIISLRSWAYAGDWRRSYRRIFILGHWTPFVTVHSF
jgi:hypothetical protein